ncbi:hypothetical protein ACFSX5_19030 [Devosia albogilva]|uniref:Uncharacterized protein n=1 Tax=Devosia albogilva TaxID=429726 RepID=A0ABW5QQV3_9HYPH
MMPSIASRLRLALLMFFGVYPVITLYIYALFPLTNGWQMWQRTLLLVPLMVLTMVFFVMPSSRLVSAPSSPAASPPPPPDPDQPPLRREGVAGNTHCSGATRTMVEDPARGFSVTA